jgi:hypothetical protein
MASPRLARHDLNWRRRSARLLAAGALGVVLGGALAAPAGAGPAGSDGAAHVRAVRGGQTQTKATPLVDGGGKILPGSKTYAIFWGTPSQFPSDEETALPILLAGFGGSNYLGIAGQYMRGAAIDSTFVTSLVDTSAPPKHQPATSTIVAEVASVLAANGLTPDASAIYFVFTSNDPVQSYCAWHSAGPIGATTVQVAYMPNTAGMAGCDPVGLYVGANHYSSGTQSIADSAAHEFMEAVTDAVPTSAWADKNGAEIADKCNFTYNGTVTLHNHSTWKIQQEWSNAAGGCVQGN